MISLEEKISYLQYFLEKTPEKSAFLQTQRLLWEKSIFPNRFPRCSTFLCSLCKGKSLNLSVCLSCGHVYCLRHFSEHSCPKTMGVDILTKQLFVWDPKMGRKFLFDALIDRLIVSAKIAVIDGIPFFSELDPPSPIFPIPRSPMQFHNLGSTCWLNSILQCLMANPLVEKYFTSGVFQIEECDSCISAVHLQLQKLFLSQNGEGSFSLNDLLFCIWAQFPDLNTPDERDCHEFFMKLRTSLEDFYSERFGSKDFSNIFNWSFSVVESCESCDQTQRMHIPESMLILPIANCSGIKESLNQFLLGESPMKCTQCGRSSRKQYYFHTLPQTLTIALSRFTEDRNIAAIQLEEVLVLDKYIEADNKVPYESVTYSLIAAVVRPKSSDSGHFRTHVKRSGNWFRCDDNIIKPVDIQEVLRDDAYLLFYIKNGFIGRQ